MNDNASDFVYVGLINSVHYEYAKRFLDAGKNVIVEKPFTTTAAQVPDFTKSLIADVKGLKIGLPKKVSYVDNRGFNGVDTSGIVSLEYENFLAQCIGAKDSASPSFLSIQGDGGYILVRDAPNELNSFELAVRGEEVQTFSLNKFNHRMIHEFVEFGETFERDDYSAVESSLKISLDVMKVVEQCI